ncbi:MAG: sulfite exporter TauE/SafE family protein, partial [Pseudomonadota bacterium]
ASQNTFFGFGMIVSILALGTAGLIQWPHLGFAVSLVPVAFLGFLIARPLAGRFERKSIRPWALGLATISALVLLIRSGQ